MTVVGFRCSCEKGTLIAYTKNGNHPDKLEDIDHLHCHKCDENIYARTMCQYCGNPE